VHLILLGAPGTGKGTQAKILAERYNWLHVSTGDMLRANIAQGTDLGAKAKEFMDRGALVPDELVIDMLVKRINEADAADGFVLDGFPRNLNQAQALDEALAADGKTIDMALNISVPDEDLVKRLSGRWLCRNCGAIYHEVTNPPATAGKCDNCGGELYQRDDDKPETVRARLEQQKPPADMIEHYREGGKLIDIDGQKTVEHVTEELVAAVAQGGQLP
jgi:adenylate kinase